MHVEDVVDCGVGRAVLSEQKQPQIFLKAACAQLRLFEYVPMPHCAHTPYACVQTRECILDNRPPKKRRHSIAAPAVFHTPRFGPPTGLSHKE